MLRWIQDHEAIAWWLGGLSVLTFVGTLILIPFLVARLPSDYFKHRRRTHDYDKDRHPALHHLGIFIKNALGVLLVLVGLALLALPGQGILTVLI
jgi:hypothetical protein